MADPNEDFKAKLKFYKDSMPNSTTKYELWSLKNILGMVLGIVALGARLAITEPTPPMFMQLPRLEIAHRGYSSGAPENTVKAIILAHQRRIRAIEVDLMMTLDGVIVAAHDYELSTFTNGTGLISQAKWEDLQWVRVLRGGKGAAMDKDGLDRLTRFEDIVKTAKQYKLSLIIELKPVGGQDDMTKKSIEILRQFDYIGQTVFSSFFPGILMDITRQCPEANTMLIYNHAGFSIACKPELSEMRSSIIWNAVCMAPGVLDWISSYFVELITKFAGAGIIAINVNNPNIADFAYRAQSYFGLKVVIWTVNSSMEREIVNSIPGNENGSMITMSDCPHSICKGDMN